jgi:hypothetical protein
VPKSKKTALQERSNTEIRTLILDYFYNRNAKATSGMGKRGAAVKISDVKSELKNAHSLTQQQVQGNLTYLISQGWIEEKPITKQVVARGGTTIPSTTTFYQITASGIDKIEGPGEFTMPKFHGIKIEATGQNIITLGDGNQVNAAFGEIGSALVRLKDAVVACTEPEDRKMEIVADIDTMQSQLAKPTPNINILSAAWDSVSAAATIGGCADLVHQVATLLAPLLGLH